MAEGFFQETNLIEGERTQLIYKFGVEPTIKDFDQFANATNERINENESPLDIVLDIREVKHLPLTISTLRPALDTISNPQNVVYSILITPAQDKFKALFDTSFQTAGFKVRFLREENGAIEAGNYKHSVAYVHRKGRLGFR